MDVIHEEAFYVNKVLRKTKIREIMTSPVVQVYEDDDLSLAEVRFLDYNISHLPVVSREGRLVGLLSQKYIYKAQSPRKIVNEEQELLPNLIVDGDSFYEKETLDRYILRYIMKKNPFTLHPEDNIAEAVLNMADKNLGCIPVVDGRWRVCGIITNREIVHYMAQLMAE